MQSASIFINGISRKYICQWMWMENIHNKTRTSYISNRCLSSHTVSRHFYGFNVAYYYGDESEHTALQSVIIMWLWWHQSHVILKELLPSKTHIIHTVNRILLLQSGIRACIMIMEQPWTPHSTILYQLLTIININQVVMQQMSTHGMLTARNCSRICFATLTLYWLF